jgi:hypothetical protein
VFDHFNNILGDFEERSHSLDFASLGFPVINLSRLDNYFSEDEV